nr:4956_t:CDS:2 [Entrophospora candida]
MKQKKHKVETLQNASNQLLDFQEKLTEEMRKEPLLESTAAIIIDEDSNGKSVKDYYKTLSPTNKGQMKNPFLSDDEDQTSQHFKELKKSKSPFWNKGNMLSDEESFISALSGQNVGDIYANKISENTKATKKKKKLMAIEKSILCYGASNIIDLSAHMKSWFCVDDKKFIMKNHKSMLRVPELAGEDNLFVGVDIGEWEFSVRAVVTKTISDRCHSTQINQSILNGLLKYNFNDEQVRDIQVPFLQFGGTSGQLLIEDLDMYKKMCKTIENLETTHHEFDDIFSDDDIVDTAKPTHCKYKYIHKPWWTPKAKKS